MCGRDERRSCGRRGFTYRAVAIGERTWGVSVILTAQFSAEGVDGVLKAWGTAACGVESGDLVGRAEGSGTNGGSCKKERGDEGGDTHDGLDERSVERVEGVAIRGRCRRGVW